MARKKKFYKDLNEPTTPTTPATAPTTTLQLHQEDFPSDTPSTVKKLGSFDELLLHQQSEQQKQQTQAQAQLAEHKAQQYQSDSGLMELKQKLNLEKNKSNLFLIKSYSFNDKTNTKRPKNLNEHKKLNEEDDKYRHLLLLDGSTSLKNNVIHSPDALSKSHKSEEKELEKPKKPPKLKKMKKSKSTNDSSPRNEQQLKEALRKPAVILENVEVVTTVSSSRPLSMPPITQTNPRTLVKSKTLDDIETPRLKRDSFLRHSLQSIRRSFSSAKNKPQNNNNIISFNSNSTASASSSSTSSSNSSAASDTLKKSKTQDCAKDIGNLNDVEECNNHLVCANGEEEAFVSSVLTHAMNTPCNIVITLNDAQQLLEKQQQPKLEHEQHVPPSSTLYTMETLAVLKEEDEKDLTAGVNMGSSDSSSSNNSNNNNNSLNGNPSGVIPEQRSTSSVSTLAQLPTSSMAPLQTHTECQSVQCLNILDKDYKSSSSTYSIGAGTSSSSSPPQILKKAFQHQLSIPESLQSTSIGCATSSEYSSARSLKHSGSSFTPLPTLNSSGSLRSISPSRRSASSNSSSTAKHEQSTTAAATAAAAATATTSNGSSSTTPPEKEKKRKEISSSRVKKFHRHFSQVSKDEKLINYFSCALVSDILLQGHLYITDQHFAFYSNVFGYVTKVVIPTSSVTKISKEKTAKIIPNAVGVATADERHVFGSFISREAAFRLMCSVCSPLGVPEILPKDPANIEISEEYSIEDDSSCSISGNESPAQIQDLQNSSANGKLLHTETSQTLLRRSVGSSNLSIAETSADKLRHSDTPLSAKTTTNTASPRSSAPAATCAHYVNGVNGGGGAGVSLLGLKTVLEPAATLTRENAAKITLIAGCASTTTSATSTPTPSTSSSPTTVMNLPNSKMNRVMSMFSTVSKKLMLHLKFPTEIHVVYLGVMLTLLLALFSIFLLYRILDIEAKANGYRSPEEFNWRSGNDDDIFSEALRFQQQLQLKSTEEAQNILKNNLEQIAKVRRSLETLSMLIHDRSSDSTNTDDSD